MKLLPSGDLLAWGGATGSIVCFQPSSISNSDDGTAAAAAVAVAPRLVRPRDDPDDHIRAVAVSHDGTRVALGMDSGSTLVYHCDDDDSIDDATQHHFFCSPSTNNNAPWIGPTFSAGVRDLAFHPACRDVLAVATEEGLCVLRIILGEDDPTTNDAPRFVQCLVERAAEQHQSSGMRSVAFSTPDIGSTTTTTLASLAMDGRVCLWNCNSGSGSGGGNSTTTTTTTSMALSPSDWTCVYRSPTSVVPKKDVGELLGADAWDRSCRPLFFSVLGDDGATSLAVALPGDTTVQVWVYNRPAACWQDSSTTTTAATRSFPSSMEAVAPPPHTDSIVTLAVSGDNRGLTSSGRDGRIVLWKIAKVQPVRRRKGVVILSVCVFLFGME